MDHRDALDETTLAERLALLALVELGRRGETPATAQAVRDCCGDHLHEVATAILWTPTEVDVAKTLKELVAHGLVTERTTAPTVTGKGRPRYEATIEDRDALATLAEDDRLAPVVAGIRGLEA